MTSNYTNFPFFSSFSEKSTTFITNRTGYIFIYKRECSLTKWIQDRNKIQFDLLNEIYFNFNSIYSTSSRQSKNLQASIEVCLSRTQKNVNKNYVLKIGEKKASKKDRSITMDVLSLKRCSDGMNNNSKFKNNTTTADTDSVPHRQ